ncbi:hypothetical protein NC653_000744 [Populus alba x Populus x berolinensis]|uniref:Uncharacterized protein n=1 Tax=Populus alba x Populus x berolinensis TaxID=444605 RepID=A0AAD6RKD1_9ROSI|nr:hypothetical protein NC653_000744 [Populus alba x Populus x berolinensis]
MKPVKAQNYPSSPAIPRAACVDDFAEAYESRKAPSLEIKNNIETIGDIAWAVWKCLLIVVDQSPSFPAMIGLMPAFCAKSMSLQSARLQNGHSILYHVRLAEIQPSVRIKNSCKNVKSSSFMAPLMHQHYLLDAICLHDILCC